jgi:hypothetical protein
MGAWGYDWYDTDDAFDTSSVVTDRLKKAWGTVLNASQVRWRARPRGDAREAAGMASFDMSSLVANELSRVWSKVLKRKTRLSRSYHYANARAAAGMAIVLRNFVGRDDLEEAARALELILEDDEYVRNWLDPDKYRKAVRLDIRRLRYHAANAGRRPPEPAEGDRRSRGYHYETCRMAATMAISMRVFMGEDDLEDAAKALEILLKDDEWIRGADKYRKAVRLEIRRLRYHAKKKRERWQRLTAAAYPKGKRGKRSPGRRKRKGSRVVRRSKQKVSSIAGKGE